MTSIKNKIIILNDVDHFDIELDEDKLVRLTFMDYDQFITDKLIDDTLHDITTSNITENNLTMKIGKVVKNCKINGIIDNKNILFKIYNYLRSKLPSLTDNLIINSILKIQIILNAYARALE